MSKGPALVHQTATAQAAPPYPAPTVYVVQAQPWGWIILAGVLFLLWVVALFRSKKTGPPGIELHAPMPPPLASQPLPPPPEIPVDPPVPQQDYSEKRREIESALRGFGMKAPEIKQHLAALDLRLPLETLVAQVLRGIAK